MLNLHFEIASARSDDAFIHERLHCFSLSEWEFVFFWLWSHKIVCTMMMRERENERKSGFGSERASRALCCYYCDMWARERTERAESSARWFFFLLLCFMQKVSMKNLCEWEKNFLWESKMRWWERGGRTTREFIGILIIDGNWFGGELIFYVRELFLRNLNENVLRLKIVLGNSIQNHSIDIAQVKSVLKFE
jgi:hypothetical protein